MYRNNIVFELIKLYGLKEILTAVSVFCERIAMCY